MRHNRFRYFSLCCLLVILAGLPACQDDDEPWEEPSLPSDIQVDVVSNPWKIPRIGNIYTFHVTYDRPWEVTCNADWVTFTYKGEEGDGYVQFSVPDNDEDFSRETLLNITDADDPNFKTQIRLRQLGNNDDDNATQTGDLQRKHRLGYGYNILGDYANDNSFSISPILDYDKMVETENKEEISLVTEDRRHYQRLEVFSGNTVTELAGKLTKSQSDEEMFLGCGRQFTSETSLYKNVTVDQACGYTRLSQIVASRTLDIGNLRSVITTDDSPLLSGKFRSAIKQIKTGKLSIEQFLDEFGTHLVTSADLGGAMNLSTLISRQSVIEGQHAVSTVTKRFFGLTVGISSSVYDKYNIITSKDYQAQLDCIGGSSLTQNKLKRHVSYKKIIPPADIAEWQESFNGDFNSSKYNVRLVGCKLLPITEFIFDERIKDEITKAITKRAGSVAFSVPTPTRKVYYVKINDARQSHMTYSPGVVMFTWEYVPAISKYPVYVVYPLLNGHPNLYNGFFLGNRDHNPGAVRWIGGNSYYEPDENLSEDDIEGIYIHSGNIYTGNPINTKNIQRIERYDIQYFKPFTPFLSYTPFYFIKIGSDYWSEQSINISPFLPGGGIPTFYNSRSDGSNYFYYTSDIGRGSIDMSCSSTVLLEYFAQQENIDNLLAVCNGDITLLWEKNEYGDFARHRWSTGLFFGYSKKEKDYFFILKSLNEYYRLSKSGRIQLLPIEDNPFVPVYIVMNNSEVNISK